jgi:8-hydroxy-5-deazaflavin:NADPH oxidoreductase
VKIAILGGTGKLGLAFAQRLQRTEHEVAIGSRDASNADKAAKTVSDRVRGMTNEEAAAWCDLAVVSVPYAGHHVLLESAKGALQGKIIVDATVPIDPGNLFQIKTTSGTSAAEETAAIVSGANVFAAFQTISHRVLRKVDLMHDVLVAGGTPAKAQVMEMIRTMGLHPIDSGPIEVAGHLERQTVLLLSINKANHIKESGIKITGVQ